MPFELTRDMFSPEGRAMRLYVKRVFINDKFEDGGMDGDEWSDGVGTGDGVGAGDGVGTGDVAVVWKCLGLGGAVILRYIEDC